MGINHTEYIFKHFRTFCAAVAFFAVCGLISASVHCFGASNSLCPKSRLFSARDNRFELFKWIVPVTGVSKSEAAYILSSESSCMPVNVVDEQGKLGKRLVCDIKSKKIGCDYSLYRTKRNARVHGLTEKYVLVSQQFEFAFLDTLMRDTAGG